VRALQARGSVRPYPGFRSLEDERPPPWAPHLFGPLGLRIGCWQAARPRPQFTQPTAKAQAHDLRIKEDRWKRTTAQRSPRRRPGPSPQSYSVAARIAAGGSSRVVRFKRKTGDTTGTIACVSEVPVLAAANRLFQLKTRLSLRPNGTSGPTTGCASPTTLCSCEYPVLPVAQPLFRTKKRLRQWQHLDSGRKLGCSRYSWRYSFKSLLGHGPRHLIEQLKELLRGQHLIVGQSRGVATGTTWCSCNSWVAPVAQPRISTESRWCHRYHALLARL
jgi:hypothetical protein